MPSVGAGVVCHLASDWRHHFFLEEPHVELYSKEVCFDGNLLAPRNVCRVSVLRAVVFAALGQEGIKRVCVSQVSKSESVNRRCRPANKLKGADNMGYDTHASLGDDVFASSDVPPIKLPCTCFRSLDANNAMVLSCLLVVRLALHTGQCTGQPWLVLPVARNVTRLPLP